MDAETKLERFKLILQFLLYPAGLILRHPILTLLAWMAFTLFTRIYNIQLLSNLVKAYIALSFMTAVIGIGLVSKNKWVKSISVVVALLMMFTPLLMRSLI